MPVLRQTVLEEIEGDPPRVDIALLECLAEHAHEARKADTAQGIAEGQCVEVRTDGGFPPWFDGIALAEFDMVIVRPSHDPALLALRILHELAHLLLDRTRWAHSHGDVWVLTLALAAPGSVLRGARPTTALDLAALARVPAWVAAARLAMRETLAA